ncbi:S-adenosyl-L-methionine-dependent methyltransferase [Westerdykella ornata]|uniref:S-adenosyl-L-methionine-dependent methyltransferase n=1 Tax=Westerdykella ornata TaxID=318751 RepID=A0A6A6JKV5_WESOR|nr:S-adenosyl-L-methionine-dependent methyltransferase [Westerdykella ornata]KAF2277221.1 S-adenosyl-L-methionine-dependent methyltransferase [Westerdykella ornata]
MSLYYEAAALLANSDKTGGSLKSRIYRKKDLKSPPAQIVALITESSKWSAVLKDVIEKSGLLAEEKKLTPTLALLLTHDLLISKRGVAAPAGHVLKLAINRHKARLSAELTKARVKAGHATLEAFREALNNGRGAGGLQHPRWVRINTLKTNLEKELSSTFAGYEKTTDLRQVMSVPPPTKLYFLDPHIPNLLALPPRIDLSRTTAYTSGRIIFQDKASCFPAYLLDPKPEDGDVVDGCAAPGNKTTHLAAILVERAAQEGAVGSHLDVIAFERDRLRTKTLEKMIKLASADKVVSIKGASDFLNANPNAQEFENVGAILLDPSCSGTGIVGRDDALTIHLPEMNPTANGNTKSAHGKKRKRDGEEKAAAQSSVPLQLELDDSVEEESPAEDQLTERLTALATFQLRILTHAMKFPNARKITYSTCSIHFEENEDVVFQALSSPIAKQHGWRILQREEQVSGMKDWPRRGVFNVENSDITAEFTPDERKDVLEACIRCDKATEDGTMGFFVAAFSRDKDAIQKPSEKHDSVPGGDSDEEWNGFSDGDEASTRSDNSENQESEASNPKKKNKREK